MNPLCKKESQTSTLSSIDIVPRRTDSESIEAKNPLIASLFQEAVSDDDSSSGLAGRCSIESSSSGTEEEEGMQASDYLSLAKKQITSSLEPASLRRVTELLRLYLEALDDERFCIEEIPSKDIDFFVVLLRFLEKRCMRTVFKELKIPIPELGRGMVMSIEVSHLRKDPHVSRLSKALAQKFPHLSSPLPSHALAALLALPGLPCTIRTELLEEQAQSYLLQRPWELLCPQDPKNYSLVF